VNETQKVEEVAKQLAKLAEVERGSIISCEVRVLAAPIAKPRDVLVRRFCSNPAFESAVPAWGMSSSYDIANNALRLVMRDADPIPLSVPEGCDTVEILYSGGVLLTPDKGTAADLDNLVAVGTPKVVPGAGLTAGFVFVTVPWQVSALADIDAGHLRVPLVARFFKKAAA
jgi:hypothetical protein